VRVALIVIVEVTALVALLLFAAHVAIPLAAPPPTLATPTIPQGALHDCPPVLRGC
jgi:hypothetical protein